MIVPALALSPQFTHPSSTLCLQSTLQLSSALLTSAQLHSTPFPLTLDLFQFRLQRTMRCDAMHSSYADWIWDEMKFDCCAARLASPRLALPARSDVMQCDACDAMLGFSGVIAP